MGSTDKPRRVALFVGVNEYRDTSIPALSGAVADAKALHAFFSSHEGQFDATEILANPTAGDILDKIGEMTASLSVGDFFLFFFAGHGIVDEKGQNLVCSDTRIFKGNLNGGFPLDNVTGKEKWNMAIILDACRSPLDRVRAIGNVPRKGTSRDIGFYESLVAGRRSEDASLSVLCSCDEGMTAGEVGDGTTGCHGLFTLALLDVLNAAADGRHGIYFDQNLGDEIGQRMREIAREGGNSNQRPWIKASGASPMLYLATMDIDPLYDWVRDFQKGGWISPDVAGECIKAVGGSAANPVVGKGIFEAIRFMAEWGRERLCEEPPREMASALLNALCQNVREPAQPDSPQPFVTVQVDAEGDMPSRPLSVQERRRLRTAAEGVVGRWRADGAMRAALGRMAAAQTDREALDALRDAEAALRDAFVGENFKAAAVGSEYANRVERLFSDSTWNTLRHELFSLYNPTAVDDALGALFKVAGACCRIGR